MSRSSARATAARPPARQRGRAAARDEFTPTPWPAALLMGVLGGLCAVLAFPPYDLWMLLPIALALLLGGLLVRSALLAVFVSLLWGLAFFVPLTEWASTYAGAMPWLALGTVQALYIVLFGGLARTVMVRRGLGPSTLVIVAGLWVAVESLRSHWPWGGLPWGASGFALSSSPLLSLAPWVGMAGLAFAVAVIGQLLLLGVLALLGRRRTGLVGFAGVWPCAAAVALVLLTLVVPHPVNRAPSERPSMTIAAIQGSMGEIDPVSYAMPDDVFDNHLEITHQTLATAQQQDMDLDLVVWPEDSTGWDPRQDPLMAEQLTAIAREADAPLLVGTQAAVDDNHRLNQAVLFAPDGSIPYTYSKRHPVPFGEYIPQRELFRKITDKVDLVSMDMLPGEEVGDMDLAALGLGEDTAGVLICFEIAYDNLVHDVVDDGAEVIIVQSNNALFGHSHEAIQQLAEAKVMAVMSGRSVVHISTVGHSAIFSPEGRRIDVVDHWEQGALLADVPLRTATTPAVAAGPWIAVGLSALGLLGLLASLASPHRALARTSRSSRSSRTSKDRR